MATLSERDVLHVKRDIPHETTGLLHVKRGLLHENRDKIHVERRRLHEKRDLIHVKRGPATWKGYCHQQQDNDFIISIHVEYIIYTYRKGEAGFENTNYTYIWYCISVCMCSYSIKDSSICRYI